VRNGGAGDPGSSEAITHSPESVPRGQLNTVSYLNQMLLAHNQKWGEKESLQHRQRTAL